MSYILILVDADGRLQCGITSTSEVPAEVIRPGMIGFTIKPEDMKARHNHEPSQQKEY